jgi:hypothetical protein
MMNDELKSKGLSFIHRSAFIISLEVLDAEERIQVCPDVVQGR